MNRYKFDVFMVRLRRKIKSFIPNPILLRMQRKKEEQSKFDISQLFMSNNPPWSSPNIWEEIVQFYQKRDHPMILEYGMGSSTLLHIENLHMQKGGTYIGIEINEEWFWAVLSALSARFIKMGNKTIIESTTLSQINQVEKAIDVHVSGENVKAILKLRTEKLAYVTSNDKLCDVAIVDGAFRQLCVNYILDQKIVKAGGMLMLMEAGRGNPNWWEGKLYGEIDYSCEVDRLINMGGKILDGNGIDSWPNCTHNSPRPVSYYYPMEACRLILNNENH